MTVWQHLLEHFTPTSTHATPGELAVELDPTTVQTPALDLIDQHLVNAANTPDSRLIITMPPQEGKSQRISRRFPLWLLRRNPNTRLVLASYEARVAARWGRTVRNDILTHPHLGLRLSHDLKAQHEWQLQGSDGGMFTAGIGAALTGRPADWLIIDDPVKGREQADSQTYRERAWDWWRETAATRLAPGAGVTLVLTRWHQDDLAGRLLKAEDGHVWTVLNIPAQCDNPDTDPLGRQDGEFMQSARGRTTTQWEAIKTRSGPRSWQALYQGQPTPPEGGLLQRQWWQHWHQPPPLDGQIIQSWDMSFKGTSTSDYVVGQVWLKRGADFYLLDQARGRWTFTETLRQVQQLKTRWPMTTAILVEDKANGTAVIDALRHNIPGLIPIEPQGGKESRTSAISPFVEAGNVHLPNSERYPWVLDLIEEAASFPNGTHDDQVDTLSQAITWLHLTTPAERHGTAFYNIG